MNALGRKRRGGKRRPKAVGVSDCATDFERKLQAPLRLRVCDSLPIRLSSLRAGFHRKACRVHYGTRKPICLPQAHIRGVSGVCQILSGIFRLNFASLSGIFRPDFARLSGKLRKLWRPGLHLQQLWQHLWLHLRLPCRRPWLHPQRPWQHPLWHPHPLRQQHLLRPWLHPPELWRRLW